MECPDLLQYSGKNMETLKITSRISLNFHQHLSQNLHDILILLGLGRLASATLLGEEDSVDAGDDPGFLVVSGSVAGELKDLSGEVLHDGGQVDRGSGSNPLGVVSLAEKPVDTAHRELETSAAGPGLCLHLGLATFTTAGHCEDSLGCLSLVEVNQAIL